MRGEDTIFSPASDRRNPCRNFGRSFGARKAFLTARQAYLEPYYTRKRAEREARAASQSFDI